MTCSWPAWSPLFTECGLEGRTPPLCHVVHVGLWVDRSSVLAFFPLLGLATSLFSLLLFLGLQRCLEERQAAFPELSWLPSLAPTSWLPLPFPFPFSPSPFPMHPTELGVGRTSSPSFLLPDTHWPGLIFSYSVLKYTCTRFS